MKLRKPLLGIASLVVLSSVSMGQIPELTCELHDSDPFPGWLTVDLHLNGGAPGGLGLLLLSPNSVAPLPLPMGDLYLDPTFILPLATLPLDAFGNTTLSGPVDLTVTPPFSISLQAISLQPGGGSKLSSVHTLAWDDVITKGYIISYSWNPEHEIWSYAIINKSTSEVGHISVEVKVAGSPGTVVLDAQDVDPGSIESNAGVLTGLSSGDMILFKFCGVLIGTVHG
jgi:hypothetical protein